MVIIRLCHPNDQPERIDHLEEHPEHTALLLTNLLSNTDTTSFQRQALEGKALSQMIQYMGLPGVIHAPYMPMALS